MARRYKMISEQPAPALDLLDQQNDCLAILDEIEWLIKLLRAEGCLNQQCRRAGGGPMWAGGIPPYIPPDDTDEGVIIDFDNQFIVDLDNGKIKFA